jgi:hypothetical protein
MGNCFAFDFYRYRKSFDFAHGKVCWCIRLPHGFGLTRCFSFPSAATVLPLVRNGFSPFAHTGGEDFSWSRSESGFLRMPIVCQLYANWGKRRETIR